MHSFLLAGLLFSFVIFGAQSITLTQNYGENDNFASTGTSREWVPKLGLLASNTCLAAYDWRKTAPYNFAGDNKPNIGYFDTKPIDNGLLWTVSNLPKDQAITSARIELMIRGNHDNCSNDGIGFLWDDNTNCKVPFFRQFTNFTGFGTWGNGVTKFINITFDSLNQKMANDKTPLQRIQETGYFHFLVGDDTSVDYFRFIYSVPDPTGKDLVSFSCNSYLNSRTLTRDTVVYSDDSATITTIIETTKYPLSGTYLISTPVADRTRTESTFKLYIYQATQIYLYVPKSVTLSWTSAGGWDLIVGASVTLTRGSSNTEFNVYTKRYEGDRWVVFGAASGTTVSSAMYFVSYTAAPTLVVVPSNPSAACACSSTGDPHYVTWDNRRFDLYSPGVFHLVKARDCSFDVQTLTFRYGASVTVNGIVSIRYLNDVVTLARTPGSAGAAWTGSPIVRINGVTTTVTKTQGGLTVTKASADEWTVSIPAVGLSVKAQASGNWFHVYPTLSDPSYQRKVDGLCGNCDQDSSNDFLTPSCNNGVTSTLSKCSHSDVASWGNSWSVAVGEQVASLANVSLSNSGTLAYSTCQATPIVQQCPQLVQPEPPKTVGNVSITVTEPVEPKTFVSCSGTTPVHVDDDDNDDNDDNDDDDDDDDDGDDGDDDDDDEDDDVPKLPPQLCTNRTDYSQIKAKCAQCAQTKLYPDDDCILDICESFAQNKTINDYVCTGLDICITATITKNITYETHYWATLDDATAAGLPPTSPSCQPKSFRVPIGWEVAPDDDLSKKVIALYSWEATCVTVGSGASYGTLATKADGFVGVCPTKTVIKPDDSCYHSNYCGVRILIRKPKIAECGNGIMETGEQCDDGNRDNNDGCSNSCQTNVEEYSCVTTVNPTRCITTVNQEVETIKHTCLETSPHCSGCIVTVDNQSWKTCCICQMPCCV